MTLGVQSTVIDQNQDLSLNNFEESVKKLQGQLEEFGLTANQSKVYIFLGKHGVKTAAEVNRALKLPRTETYQILATLQNKGIVSAIFGHPIKFSAIGLTNVITSIINTEKQRIGNLEKQKVELEKLWQSIPIGNNEKTTDEKFQMLQGENQINSKINEMINKSQKELFVVGNEKDFVNFYHAGILDGVVRSANFKILTASTQKTAYVFDGMNRKSIRNIPSHIQDNLCFIIKDDEVLFYMNNKSKKDATAMWTNSNAMTYSKKLLFEELWIKSSEIKKEI